MAAARAWQRLGTGALDVNHSSDDLLGPDLPFPGTVGPEHAVAHRGWREACDRALAAVLAGPGLVLVVGPPGTGKTLLLQHLARELRASGMYVLLSTRGDLDLADDEITGSESERSRAVLIDEADRLGAESMERLARLGRCAFVLAGVIEPREDDRPLAAEGTTIVRLAPLAPDEVGAFVTARLAQAGLRPDLLTDAAIERLAALSGGLPRVLNMLTGSALFLARIAHAPHVDAAHVIEAATLREGEPDLIPERPAEPSPPVDPPATEPPATDARPGRALTVVPAGKPLRAPAVMLTGASPSRTERTRRPSHVVLAGLFVTAGLAAAGAWFLIHPGQPAQRAVSHPEAALESTSPAPPPLRTVQPEPGRGSAETTIPSAATPPAAISSAADVPVRERSVKSSEDRARSSESKPGARHRSDQRRTWRGEPRPAAPAPTNGTLGLGGRAPAGASHQGVGSQSPPPAPAEHRSQKYIGVYTTGPDGVRTFRASPE